jgi:hypothetical protein
MAVRPNLRETKLLGSTRSSLFAAINASVDFKCPEIAARPYLRETKLPGSTRS